MPFQNELVTLASVFAFFGGSRSSAGFLATKRRSLRNLKNTFIAVARRARVVDFRPSDLCSPRNPARCCRWRTKT